jgi:hypothetical protein
MAERSRVLADEFEQAVSEFIGTVEGLSEEQWRMLCPNEERSIGVLARHVAAGIPFQMDVFGEIAGGGQPTTISGAEFAVMNAGDAEAWKDARKDETLALLRENTEAAASEVRQLSEDQLAISGKYITDIPDAWTVEQWIERVLIGHVRGHLESVRAVLEPGKAP